MAASGQTKQWRRNRAELERLRSEQRVAGANALQAQRQAIGTVGAGYNAALATTSQAGAQMGADARASGDQALASGSASLQQRGLGSALDNYAGGTRADTTTALGEISSSIAGIQSQLQAQRGEAIAGQEGGLASLLGGVFQQRAGTAGNYANFLADFTKTPGRDKGTSIASLFGLAGGLALGGKKGAGSTQSLPSAGS